MCRDTGVTSVIGPRRQHLLPSLNDFGVKPRNCVSYSCSLATLGASTTSPPDTLRSLDTLVTLTLCDGSAICLSVLVLLDTKNQNRC